MQPSDLITKLIDLQEKANSHLSEFQKLEHIPGKKSIASVHGRKAARLGSRINELIREIAECRCLL